VVQAFYSLKDTLTPMKVAIFNVGLNIVLDIVLVRYLGLAGLALATAISSAVGFAILCWLLRRRLGDIRGREIWTAVVKMIVVSALVGIALYLVAGVLEPLAVNIWGKLLQVTVSAAAGLAVLVTAGLAVKAEEIIFLLRTMLRVRVRR
jgi:putative peptidoglycan lipid II flippase